MSGKLLIIAGTHFRENGFSHSVADLVLEELGLSPDQPQVSYRGIDNAREAELWNLERIAIAKVKKIGEPSREYLKGLSVNELVSLALFKIDNLNNGAEYPEEFEGRAHNTSVHGWIKSVAKPTLQLDLHSYHAFTAGMPGTGADIMAYPIAQPSFSIFQAALEKAKRENPGVYGLEPQSWANRLQEGISKDCLVSLLTNPSKDKKDYDDFMQKLPKKDRRQELSLEDAAKEWGNNWVLRGPKATEQYYCFEGVHWGPEQQRATAKFIVNYLRPLL